MLPTRDQIELAAYDRWLRRHRAHGHDRDDWVGSENELTYLLNYQPLVEYPLDSPRQRVLGDGAARRCRFCERTARYTEFSAPRRVVQNGAETALYSSQICDECESDCRGPLALHCTNFWELLRASADRDPILPRRIDSLAIFKSLVTSALLIMPERELAYFNDTVEWVNNPDHSYDADLFAGSDCHLYRAPFLSERSWTSLARRNDDQSPFHYMLFFLAWGGSVVQISLPLCVRDHDLDGRNTRLPVRSLAAGEGPHFCATHTTVLRLVDAPCRTRRDRRRELIFP